MIRPIHFLDWSNQSIGALCTVIAGQSPSGSSYNESGEGLPFYQGKKDFTERYLAAPSVWTTEVTKRALPRDILMSVRAPVGPINEAVEEICIGRGLAAIRPGGKICQQFLWYVLLWLQPSIVGNDGAVFPSINKSQIEALEIPVPPLDEQKRIVAVLDQAFAALDRARANVDKNTALANKMPGAWMQGILSEGTDWPMHRLADVCENLDSQRVPITKSDREAGDVPYYGASGVVDYVKGFLFDEELLLVSEDGANLLARKYPIAFSIKGKSWVNNHAHVLRFSLSATLAFVRIYLNSISLKPYVTGMAQPKLNQGALNAIRIPIPPLKVQEEIVHRENQLATASKKTVAAYEAQLADIAALRQSLLQAAFSGQLS